MKTKVLIILLIVVCLLSFSACNILDMASQTTARSNAENSLTIARNLNYDIVEYPIYILVFGDKEINFQYIYKDSKLQLYDGATPIVESEDLVFINDNASTLDYDYSASRSITTNEDIVKNILVLVKVA